jgi:aminopeptidase N
MVVYFKSAIWLYIMEITFKREGLDKAMQNYFNKWKFKHPYPEDFKAALEESLKTNVDQIFEIRNKSGSLE